MPDDIVPVHFREAISSPGRALLPVPDRPYTVLWGIGDLHVSQQNAIQWSYS
jgi:hypothetical protein